MLQEELSGLKEKHALENRSNKEEKMQLQNELERLRKELDETCSRSTDAERNHSDEVHLLQLELKLSRDKVAEQERETRRNWQRFSRILCSIAE